MPKLKIAPSVLSADFGNLKADIGKVQKAGADMLHVDVMDGHFVPNITIGPVVVKGIKAATPLPLDVHLMIARPQQYLDDFIAAGSDMITVHIEAVKDDVLRSALRYVRKKGVRAGLSLNPATPLRRIIPYLKDVDLILVMTVNPGFAGQAFKEEVVPKIAALRKAFLGEISVDGGITQQTAARVVDAGATILVAGTYIFKAANYRRAIQSLKCLAR